MSKPSLNLLGLHHVALICSDYARSKAFYTELLGLPILAEHYRADKASWKLDLGLPDGGQLELFSFASPPERASYPEACGLRHLAFRVASVQEARLALINAGLQPEPLRMDPYTQQAFCFFADPDGLPLELYEAAASKNRY